MCFQTVKNCFKTFYLQFFFFCFIFTISILILKQHQRNLMIKHIFLFSSFFVIGTLQASLTKKQTDYLNRFKEIYDNQWIVVKNDLKKIIGTDSIQASLEIIDENIRANEEFLSRTDNQIFEHHQDSLNIIKNTKKTISKLGINPNQINLFINPLLIFDFAALFRRNPNNQMCYLPSIMINPELFINYPDFKKQHIITTTVSQIKHGIGIKTSWMSRILQGMTNELMIQEKDELELLVDQEESVQKLNNLEKNIIDIYYAVLHKDCAIDALKTNFLEFEQHQNSNVTFFIEKCMNIIKICEDVWKINAKEVIIKEKKFSKDLYTKFLNIYSEYCTQNVEPFFQILPY